jgi:RNA polymerase-binding transcription factor DksA
MEHTHKEQLKALLLQEKTLLHRELAGEAIKDNTTQEWEVALEPVESEDYADPVDGADRDEAFAVASQTVAILEARLAEVETALSALEDGSYGVCVVCHTPIEEDRLMANPSATTCKNHMNN